MDFQKKILDEAGLKAWRTQCRTAGQRLVVTNGCFDLLHLGHVTYLQAARDLGDALLVGVTSDAGVRALKGPGRPINREKDRAAVLAALESVNAVHIFPEQTALRFLEMVQPDLYVKGGDYTLDTINQEERHLIERAGGVIKILPGVPGQSTTRMAKGLRASSDP